VYGVVCQDISETGTHKCRVYVLRLHSDGRQVEELWTGEIPAEVVDAMCKCLKGEKQ
jgi:hypothetical protein